MPEVQEVQDRHGGDIILLAVLLVMIPVSSALLMWSLIPYWMGWLWPVISL